MVEVYAIPLVVRTARYRLVALPANVGDLLVSAVAVGGKEAFSLEDLPRVRLFLGDKAGRKRRKTAHLIVTHLPPSSFIRSPVFGFTMIAGRAADDAPPRAPRPRPARYSS